MIFRNYCCNPRLLTKEFKRTKYIMLLHTILLFLCTTLPAILIINNNVSDDPVWNANMASTWLCTTNIVHIMAIIVAAFGTAYFVYSHMFNKKSVIFYGSMPEKKSCIFLTKYIAGIFSLLVPFVIISVINIIISQAYAVSGLSYITAKLSLAFVQYIFLFTAFSCAASLSGNFLAMLASSAFGFLIYPITRAAISGTIDVWFNTYSSVLNMDVNYVFPPSIMLEYSSVDTKYIAFEIILTALLLAFSIFFCAKRMAENTDKFFSFKFVNVIIKWCSSAVGALVFGCIISDSFKENNFVLFAVYILFAVLLFVIFQAIFEKNFKAMFSKPKQIAVFAILFALIISVPVLNPFDLDSKIPTNPKSVEITVSNSSENMYFWGNSVTETFTDPKITDSVLAIAKQSTEYVKNNGNKAKYEYAGLFFVKFDNSPFGIYRVFPYETKETLDEFLKNIYDTPDYKKALSKAVDTLRLGNGKTQYFEITPECPYYTTSTIDKKFVEGLKKVFKEDIENYSYSDIKKSPVFAYVYTYGDSGVNLTVYSCYENTVNFLLENYLFVPATEKIEIENPENGKRIVVEDLSVIKEVFKVSRSYYNEPGDYCRVYAPARYEEDLPDEKATEIVAEANINHLPKELQEKLK